MSASSAPRPEYLNHKAKTPSKPSGSECLASDTRQAWPENVDKSDLSPRARLGWKILVSHLHRPKKLGERPYDGISYMTDETFLGELGFHGKRTAQRIRAELFEKHWICFPKGDAGGRGRDVIYYHLHPEGKPCPRLETLCKQRAATEAANQRRTESRQSKGGNPLPHQKDANPGILCGFAIGTERTPETTERTPQGFIKDARNDKKDARNDVAYKEEPLHRTPSTTPSSTPDALRSEAHVSPEFAVAAVVGVPVFKDLRHPIFEQLESMCDPPAEFDGRTRVEIFQAGHVHGFTLEQLRYAWCRQSKTKSGGLIELVRDWPAATAHHAWPKCFTCEDSGKIVLQRKAAPNSFDCRIWGHFGGETFCHCDLGVEASAGLDRAYTSTSFEGGASVDPLKEEQDRIAEEALRERQHAAFAKKAETEAKEHARVQDCHSRHVCPGCEGRKGETKFDKWHLCRACLGTGEYLTVAESESRGICHSCRGTGKIHDVKQGYNSTSKLPPWMISCPVCSGTGSYRAT